MGKLPPMTGGRGLGDPVPFVEYSIGSWAKQAGEPPTAVGLYVLMADGEGILLTLKTPREVDNVIQALLRHKRDVWPDAP